MEQIETLKTVLAHNETDAVIKLSVDFNQHGNSKVYAWDGNLLVHSIASYDYNDIQDFHTVVKIYIKNL